MAASRLRCCFIRHGESQNNVLHITAGRNYARDRFADPALTDVGQAQAEAVAQFLSTGPAIVTPLDAVFVSPMRRTLMTAQPMSKALGLRPTVWSDCYEVGGCFKGGKGEPGMTAAEIRDEFEGYRVPEARENKEQQETEKQQGKETQQDAGRDDDMAPGLDYGCRSIRSGWYEVELGEETYAHSEARARVVIERLKRKAASLDAGATSIVAMVVHHDFIDLLLRQANGGWPAVPSAGVKSGAAAGAGGAAAGGGGGGVRPGAFFLSYNCALSVVDVFSDGQIKILFTNRHEYMPDELVKRDKLGEV
eukprot:g1393.t1